jgi:hypothetical protein
MLNHAAHPRDSAGMTHSLAMLGTSRLPEAEGPKAIVEELQGSAQARDWLFARQGVPTPLLVGRHHSRARISPVTFVVMT